MAKLLVLSSLASFSLAWKAAILSDVHVDPTYQTNITAEAFCATRPDGKEVYTDQLAPYGRLGCDPPAATLELFLKRMRDQELGIDLLFMPGDFLGHSIPILNGRPFDPVKYQTLKEVHS